MSNTLPAGPDDSVLTRDVLVTEKLDSRASRPPDFETEAKTLRALAKALAEAPQGTLQRLAEEALTLCRAGSAGISIADTDQGQEIFRWFAVAGRMAPFINGTMPRSFSPCGLVVERNAVQLMKQPILHWDYIKQLEMHLEEVLLVPFHRHGKAIGTIWVVYHEPGEHFDSEDRRILTSLAQFTAAASQSYLHLKQLEESITCLERERLMRERFVATLTHDLRTPLSVAKMGAALILQDLGGSALTQKAARRIDANIDRADGLIRDLLDANQLRAGEALNLAFEACDLTQLARTTLEELGTLHGSRFVLRASDSVQGYWNPSAVRRILENLCSNAIKYGAPLTPVEVKIERAGDAVVLSIHNEGTPISVSDQTSIFDAFHRTSSAQLGDQEGWGLGLTLVRGLSQAHGGEVLVQSDEHSGTTFAVQLPSDARKAVTGAGA